MIVGCDKAPLAPAVWRRADVSTDLAHLIDTADADEVGRPVRQALAGTGAVGLMLATTRWGSYLGHAPLFLTDLLIALGIAHHVATRHVSRNVVDDDPRVRGTQPILVALFVWAFVRLALSLHLSVTALRDAAPYLYVLLGLLAVASLRRSTAEQRQRTARLLEIAVYVHAAWVVVGNLLFTSLPAHLPDIANGQHVFQARPDIDEAVCGIASALLVRRIFRGDRVRLAVVGLALVWLSIFHLANRAGLIGAGCATLLAIGQGLAGLSVERRRKLLVTAVVPVLLAIGIFTIPKTNAWQRVVATFSSSSSDNPAVAGASGTASARRRSWARQLQWDLDQPGRAIFGVGFGPNFLADSGADQLLTGTNDNDVRSPHNYWIGTYSRLGMPGIGLFAILTVLMAFAVIRLFRTSMSDSLLYIAIVVPTALLPTATLGVVLESPFGAVPYFWCAGLLLAYPAAGRFSPRRPNGSLEGTEPMVDAA
jgi:hypothetical protein